MLPGHLRLNDNNILINLKEALEVRELEVPDIQKARGL